MLVVKNVPEFCMLPSYAIVLCVTVGVGGVGWGAITFKVKQVSHRNQEFVRKSRNCVVGTQVADRTLEAVAEMDSC